MYNVHYISMEDMFIRIWNRTGFKESVQPFHDFLHKRLWSLTFQSSQYRMKSHITGEILKPRVRLIMQ